MILVVAHCGRALSSLNKVVIVHYETSTFILEMLRLPWNKFLFNHPLSPEVLHSINHFIL